MQRILINSRVIIILVSVLLEYIRGNNGQPVQNNDMSLQLIYQTQDSHNDTVGRVITIYNNSVLSPDFQAPNRFSCSDSVLFTMDQYSAQYYNRTPYTLLISNYTQDIQVRINTYYNTPPASPSSYSCPPSPTRSCNITVTMGCTSFEGFNIVSFILSVGDETILEFQFNYICYLEKFKEYQPPQWGSLILVIFSVFMIFICSKFQQARSFGNPAFYINYPFIIITSILSIVRFVLIALRVQNIEVIIYCVCLVGAILLGLPAFVVCFAEGAYTLNWRWLKKGCRGSLRCRCRVMDLMGFALGVGAFCGWLFSGTNWIISDIIFIVIYVALIKVVKFGSLKIALASFACSLVLSIVFITLATQTSVYIEIDYVNNPLFLAAPMLAPIPNQRCSWYFLIAMAYPGMFLAYLERFDKNRSSLIYSPTFLICYGVFSILWFVVGSLIKAPLPYDLFTVPISMVLLLLFANRRGELQDLWEGRFFDEQRSYYENQRQMFANLKVQKSASRINYEKELFENLRYRQQSQSSRSSKFSEIIKGARESTELRHIYSQGQQKDKKDKQFERDPLSNETQKVSKNLVSQGDSGNWTLSKYS